MEQVSHHRSQERLYRDMALSAHDREQRCHYLDLAAYHALQCEPSPPLMSWRLSDDVSKVNKATAQMGGMDTERSQRG
jgi:hypothetical protein